MLTKATIVMHALFTLRLSHQGVALRISGGGPDNCESIWSGSDQVCYGAGLSDKSSKKLDSFAMKNVKAINLQVLGSFDVGTNLLRVQLADAFELSSCHAHDLEGESFLCSNVSADKPPVVCKHNPPTDSIMQEKLLSIPNVRIVAVLRNPMAHIQSLRKAPYLLRDYREVNGTNCLHNNPTVEVAENRSCIMPFYDTPPFNPGGQHYVYHDSNKTVTTTGLTGMWNYYAKGYASLHQKALQRNIKMVVIRYEDLVLSPEVSMKNIAHELDLGEPGDMVMPEGPVKSHGEPHGRSEAVKAIKTRQYLASYSETMRNRVCAHLDAGQMSLHRYDQDCVSD